MADKRLYRVQDGENVRLIEAANPAQAIRHCAAQRYHIAPAKAADVAYLMARGVKVETAGEGEAA